MGLFGADLTDFNDDCVTLDTKCKPADYEVYSGWALGVQFAPSAAMVEGKVSYIIFEESKNVLSKTWNAGTAATDGLLKFGLSTVTPAAAAPLAS